MYTFGNGANGREKIYEGMGREKGSFRYEVPLIILGVGSIIIGYITKEIFVGIGGTLISGVNVNPINKIGIEIEEIVGIEKMLPVISTMMGGVIYVAIRKGRKGEIEMGVEKKGR